MVDLAGDLAGSAAAAAAGIYSPDVAPDSPSAYDDEFDGASLDAKWTETDQAANLTVDVQTETKQCRLTQVGSGADALSVIRQPIADDEFAFYAKVGWITKLGRWSQVGIFVAGDIATSPASADYETLMLVGGNSGTPGDFSGAATHWNDYQTSGTVRGAEPAHVTAGYLRGRYLNNLGTYTLAYDFSSDGLRFNQVASFTLAFTPVYFGLVSNGTQSGWSQIGLVDFFRVFPGAGNSAINATRIGGFL